MHALGIFLTDQLHQRGWRPADLARASGLSRQTISNLLRPDADSLGRMLEHRTITALAHGLEVPEGVIVTKAAESMGIGLERLQSLLEDPNTISDAVLVDMLRKRLARQAERNPNGQDEAL